MIRHLELLAIQRMMDINEDLTRWFKNLLTDNPEILLTHKLEEDKECLKINNQPINWISQLLENSKIVKYICLIEIKFRVLVLQIGN